MPKGNSKVIVTGASGSMGAAAVHALAMRSALDPSAPGVIMACRNLQKGGAVRDAVLRDFPQADIELRRLDLTSLESVREFAGSLAGQDIAGLFNNAGTLNRDKKMTHDGLEECAQVNCLAPALLCELLAPGMAPGSRIVNMVSLTCSMAKVKEDFFDCERFSQLGTYAMSKRGLMLYTTDLAERFPQLKINVSDPGVVNSNMIGMGRWFDPLADVLFRPFCRKPATGVSPALAALQADVTGHLWLRRLGRIVHSPIPSAYVADPIRPWLLRRILDYK